MAINKEALLDEERFTAVKLPIEVYVEKGTGNVYYPCEKCGLAFDRYIQLTDPTHDKDKPVNVLCKKCRRKYQRKSHPSVLLSYLFDIVWVRLEGEYVRVLAEGEKTAVEFLREKLSWTF